MLRAGLGTAAAVAAWCEWSTWRASRAALPRGGEPSDTAARDVVVVLGCPPRRSGALSALQRYRVRIAVRSTDVNSASFIFTGAAVRGERAEARIMSEHAINWCAVPAQNVVLEESARTTVENIRYVLPLLDDHATIKIASNTFHARRARRELWLVDPAAATRLRRAGDYRFLELGALHVALRMFEVFRATRAALHRHL